MAGHAGDAAAVALIMSNISGVMARVFVDDLDTAIPLYQQLAQTTAVNRFGFRDVQLAQVGPFLLLSGDTARYRDRVATILVRHLPRGGLRVHRDRRPAAVDHPRQLLTAATPGAARAWPPGSAARSG
jgi:hypothetical protein